MPRIRVLFAILLGVCAAPVQAQAAVDEAALAELDELLEAFTPDDALLVVRAPSAAAAGRLSFVLRDELEASLPLDPFTSLVGPVCESAARQADRELPFAVAFVPGESGEVEPDTVFMPCADADTVVAHHDGGALAHGRYAVLTRRARLQPGGARVAARGLPGDVTVTVDLATIVSTYRARIDAFLAGVETTMASAPGVDADTMRAIWEAYLKPVRMLVDGAEALDVAVSLRDTTLDVDVRLTARPGSELASAGGASRSLLDLASHLPPDLTMLAVGAGGGTMLAELASSSAQAMATAMGDDLEERQVADFRAWLARNAELTAQSLGEWALGMSMANGIRSVSVSRVGDAEAFVRAWLEHTSAPILAQVGLHYSDEGARDVAGTRVHSLRLRMDTDVYLRAVTATSGMELEQAAAMMEAWMGPDGTLLELAAEGDTVFMAYSVGDESPIEQALTSAGAPPSMGRAFARVHGDLLFAGSVELRGLMAGGLEFVRSAMPDPLPMPDVSGGEPVRIEGAIAHDGDGLRAGLSVSVTALGGLRRDLFDWDPVAIPDAEWR